MNLSERLKELKEVLQSNIEDGDHATIESNAYDLVQIAEEQERLINEFKSLVDMNASDATSKLIELSVK